MAVNQESFWDSHKIQPSQKLSATDKIRIIGRKYLAVIEVQWQYKVQFFSRFLAYWGTFIKSGLLARLRSYPDAA